MKISGIVDAIQHGIDLLKGEETVDKTYSSQNTYPDGKTAGEAFARAKEKVFDVNRWSGVSSITADFVLHDRNGIPKPAGRPEVGDYIRVELPGPTPENWVNVIQVVDEDMKAGFTARPCADPHGQTGQTEHFFTDDSTSTFRVEWQGTTVLARQIGERESINNHTPEAGGRAVVNTLIASAGWLFYQKIQWAKLLDYLVE